MITDKEIYEAANKFPVGSKVLIGTGSNQYEVISYLERDGIIDRRGFGSAYINTSGWTQNKIWIAVRTAIDSTNGYTMNNIKLVKPITNKKIDIVYTILENGDWGYLEIQNG